MTVPLVVMDAGTTGGAGGGALFLLQLYRNTIKKMLTLFFILQNNRNWHHLQVGERQNKKIFKRQVIHINYQEVASLSFIHCAAQK